MTPDIVIPTCKTENEVRELVAEIEATAPGCRVIATCEPTSAAANRNIGLDLSKTEAVVMVDDDVTGFPNDWASDLAYVLSRQDSIVMVSARLLNADGSPGQMLGDPDTSSAEGLVEVERGELPTACVAIRNDGLRFDEGYRGSGWEDTDFCARLRGVYGTSVFVVHRGVSVTHKNEQKAQARNFRINQVRFERVWGPHPYHKRSEA